MSDKLDRALRIDKRSNHGDRSSPSRDYADHLIYESEYLPKYKKQYDRERKYQSRKNSKRRGGKQ